ncbi:hypothetical protein HMPREF0424_0539 [Gardnerella vaginalis 409-05]|nr:hypothetical protein HMPREF0424_0539 [Gardnerella vaginalis 409-05]
MRMMVLSAFAVVAAATSVYEKYSFTATLSCVVSRTLEASPQHRSKL